MAAQCPKCNAENPDTQTFCGQCGTKLGTKAPISVTRTIETTPEGLGKGKLFAGRFELIEELGSGGMGIVYRAYDKEVGEEIALKVLHPEIALDERTVDRFRNEIKLARKISHRNVCRMHELHQDGKQLFITMEYVPGQDLKGLIKESGALSTGKAISIAKQVAEGLAEAHDFSVIHRDLKPQNIMVDKEGLAKIMDFGIARSLRTVGMTAEGMIVGTPEYMAPEQVEGLAADERTDIYALGAILFEMVTGRVPFEGDSPLSVTYKHKNDPPIPPRNLNSQVPEPLSTLILRCLEKEKDNRYQTADELLADLIRIEEGLPISERAVLKARPSIRIAREKPRGLKRFRIPAIIASILAIALAVIYRAVIYRPLPAPAPKVPNSIAIISFENLTGDSELDIWSRRGISERLITNLENTGYFHVATWERMRDILKQMGKKDMAYIDSDLGLSLCRQAGIELLVTGTLSKAGDVFALDVRVLNAETKALHKSAGSEGEGISSVINTQLDELSREIAEGLGMAKEKIEQTQFQVAGISTNSEEAYRFFIIAKENSEKLDTEKAVEYFQKALQFDPKFAMAYHELAGAYLTSQKMSSAIEAITKSKELSDRASEKDRLMIEAQYARLVENNREKAKTILKEITKKYPDEKDSYLDLAYILYLQDRFEDALAAVQKCLRIDPENDYAFNMLGIVHANLGEFEKAIDAIKRYIALRPGEANPWDSLGSVYAKMGRVDEAINAYKKALKIQPDFFISNHAVTYLYAAKEEYAAAIDSVDHYLSLDLSPERRADAFLWKGFCLYWLGRFSESFEVLKQAEEASRTADWRLKPVLFLMRFDLYFQMGEFEAARGSIQKYANYSIEHAADFYLTLCDIKEGQLNSARTKLERMETALREVRGWEKENLLESINFLQAEICLARELTEEAFSYIEKIDQLLSSDTGFVNFKVFDFHWRNWPQSKEQRARAYEMKGDLDRAAAEYEKLISPDPTMTNALIYPRFYYSLGKLYEQRGMKDKARRHYRRFLELWRDADPGRPEVEDARRTLAGLKGT